MNYFKKSLLIICFILVNKHCLIGQTYPIPGAIQQPAWVFPLFFEDAIGQKDTIYLGYDGGITLSYHCYDESLFNEQFIFWDTSLFSSAACITSLGNDSITSVDVSSFTNKIFGIYVFKAHYPLTIRFDTSVLNADSLPLPDQSPLPKAEVLFDYYYFPNVLNVPNCTWGAPVLLTDTCLNGCCFADSIVFTAQGGGQGPYDTFFDITFRSWTGQVVGIDESGKKETDYLFPNPARSFGKITINSSEIYSSGILKGTDGKIIEMLEIINNQFWLKSNLTGLYFLEVTDRNGNFKIFKLVFN